MTYDLAFWDGPRPHDDAEAGERYEQLTERLEDDEREPLPPTPRIAALVERLESRWPMIEDPPYPPWASWPLGGDADGELLYVNLTFDGAEESANEIAAIARELGLVCYDPQGECLV